MDIYIDFGMGLMRISVRDEGWNWKLYNKDTQSELLMIRYI